MALRIYRVSVGGFFGALDDEVRVRLLAAADEHSPDRAGFTDEGTLTYEPKLTAYRLRVQLRSREDDEAEAEASVVAQAISMTTARLGEYGVRIDDPSTLRVTATDMASMWDRSEAPSPSDDDRLEQAQRSRDVDEVAAAWLRRGADDEWAGALIAGSGVPYRMRVVEALVSQASDTDALRRIGVGPLRDLLAVGGPVVDWADRMCDASAAFATAAASS